MNDVKRQTQQVDDALTPKQVTSTAQADKAQVILAAALHVFAEKGVHGTAVPPIAKVASVSVGTLYRYFDSKEALVNAVFQDAKTRLHQQLMADLDSIQPGKPLFDAIWARLSHFASTEPDSFRFLELQDHYSYLNEKSMKTEQNLLKPLAKIIRDGQKQGLLRPDLRADLAIALFWGAFVGVFKACHLRGMTLSPEDQHLAREACWQAFGNTLERGTG